MLRLIERFEDLLFRIPFVNWLIDLAAPPLEEQDRLFAEIDAVFNAVLDDPNWLDWKGKLTFVLFHFALGYTVTFAILSPLPNA